MRLENLWNGVKSGKCCLSPKDEFIYRHGMEQIFSDFILSHVSFATFLTLRKVEKYFKKSREITNSDLTHIPNYINNESSIVPQLPNN